MIIHISCCIAMFDGNEREILDSNSIDVYKNIKYFTEKIHVT